MADFTDTQFDSAQEFFEFLQSIPKHRRKAVVVWGKDIHSLVIRHTRRASDNKPESLIVQ